MGYEFVYLGNSSASNMTNSTCFEVVPVYTHVLSILSCLSSIFGAFVIFFAYIKMNIRNRSRRLLVSLTIADFMIAFSYIIGSARYIYFQSHSDKCARLMISDATCVAQSFISTASSLASFLWTLSIAVHIVLQLSYGSTFMRTARRLWVQYLLCWGIPVIITTIAAADGVLGQDNSVGTGGWCWIKSDLNDTTQIIWMIIAGKGIELLCYILMALCYMLAHMKIHLLRSEQQRKNFRGAPSLDPEGRLRLEDKNFRWAPFVMFLLRIWGTTRFVIALAGHNVNDLKLDPLQRVLLNLQSLGDGWQAFWNFVIFCLFDAEVRRFLMGYIRRDNAEERGPLLRGNVQAKVS